MAPSLSGNTMSLKFMQRAAQRKEQAQAALPPKATKVERAPEQPVASTSQLPASTPLATVAAKKSRPAITTESSYLGFPILSTAYGTPSASEPAVNGRRTFGKQKAEDDEDEDMADQDRAHARTKPENNQPPTQRTAKKLPKGFAKPPGFDELSAPIRGRKKQPKEQIEELEPDLEEHGGGEQEEEGEEEDFVQAMVERAREKRKKGTAAAEPIEDNEGGAAAVPKKKKKRQGA